MSERPRADPPEDDTQESEKMALFCQECGHESPMTGDWLVREGTDGYHVVCPDCGTVVVAQPVFGALA
ncbi:hypothetical protein [Halosegnis sp.]|uniref:hypothetical protein n=1 Tax=Halosegnis sp. TaxID=2864959 RepID=UPI0035D4E2D3